MSLKTKYKYIEFEESPDPEMQLWICHNKKSSDHLADLIYYDPWRQWVVEFQVGCVFNNTCLNDISHFLRQLNQVQPKGKKPKSVPAQEIQEDKLF